jgi:hypothetical protein
MPLAVLEVELPPKLAGRKPFPGWSLMLAVLEVDLTAKLTAVVPQSLDPRKRLY